MKKPASSRRRSAASDRVRPDWKNARPNPHAGRIARGDGWRRLDDELAAAFPTSKDVNDALRALLALSAVLPAAAGPARGHRRRAAREPTAAE